MKIKRNIHNKLPLARSTVRRGKNLSETKKKAPTQNVMFPPQKENQEKVFCVYTQFERKEISVSKNILKINGHDFVMRNALEIAGLEASAFLSHWRSRIDDGLACWSLIRISLEFHFGCRALSVVIGSDSERQLTMLMLVMISRTC